MKKKPIKIRTQYNYVPGSGREHNTEPSQTVEGESYTIRELLEKHTQGIMPPIGRVPLFEEEPDIDNPDPTKRPDFDLTDVTEMVQDTERVMSSMSQRKKAKAKSKTQKQPADTPPDEEGTTEEKEGSKDDSAS